MGRPPLELLGRQEIYTQSATVDCILAIATNVTVARSVCLSVTLMHLAKAVGWNEMPFGRDTCSNNGNDD